MSWFSAEFNSNGFDQHKWHCDHWHIILFSQDFLLFGHNFDTKASEAFNIKKKTQTNQNPTNKPTSCYLTNTSKGKQCLQSVYGYATKITPYQARYGKQLVSWVCHAEIHEEGDP